MNTQRKMLIKEFFEGQEIFVTGGSGFIGKALIEKLLRSCSGLSKIYVLMRSKKGKSAEERLRELLNTVVFDRVRKETDSLKKVEVIEGDCSELGLGISAEDLEKLKNVTIIYHSAASVRFDDALRNAIILNTRGTYELVKMAEKWTNLKAFIHISTTYCNPDKHTVEEKIYPPYADWRTTIKLAETYDMKLLNIVNSKFSEFQPNTYTFTKSLAEQIVNEYSDRLPIVVFRPSIVISAISEPLPGWIDNFNGPTGMLVACGIGIMRTSYANPDNVSDFVPVDIVVRGIILATYKKAYIDVINNEAKKSETDVLNCALSSFCPLSLGEIIETGKIISRSNPFDKALWVPGGSITRCWFWNTFRFLVWHIVMALLVDSALYLSNRKPMLLKLQRRIYQANSALHYFMTTNWCFKNEHFIKLDALVPRQEFRIFSFMQYSTLNYICYLCESIRGARLYLLNEGAKISRGARIRVKIFSILNFILEAGVILLILRFILRFFNYKLF